MVTAYKNLARVERDFRSIKSDDLDLRPVFHRLEERVKTHVLICMLACYMTWHLRQAWAPLTYTDQEPPARDNPVAPARRSAAAQAKASAQQDSGRPTAASAACWSTCTWSRTTTPRTRPPPSTSGC